jgi:hypothetical protein
VRGAAEATLKQSRRQRLHPPAGCFVRATLVVSCRVGHASYPAGAAIGCAAASRSTRARSRLCPTANHNSTAQIYWRLRTSKRPTPQLRKNALMHSLLGALTIHRLARLARHPLAPCRRPRTVALARGIGVGLVFVVRQRREHFDAGACARSKPLLTTCPLGVQLLHPLQRCLGALDPQISELQPLDEGPDRTRRVVLRQQTVQVNHPGWSTLRQSQPYQCLTGWRRHSRPAPPGSRTNPHAPTSRSSNQARRSESQRVRFRNPGSSAEWPGGKKFTVSLRGWAAKRTSAPRSAAGKGPAAKPARICERSLDSVSRPI